MAYEVIMGLSASYAIVFVGTFTECPLLCADCCPPSNTLLFHILKILSNTPFLNNVYNCEKFLTLNLGLYNRGTFKSWLWIL